MSKRRKRLGIRFVIVFGFFLYFCFVMVEQQRILNAKSNEMIAIQEKIKEEEKLNEELKNKKDTLNSDEYIEDTARKELGMVKKGEKVFVDVNE